MERIWNVFLGKRPNSLPIVCLHGMWVNAGMFDDQAAYLENEGLPVFAIDFPGHGYNYLAEESPAGKSINDYMIYADRIISSIGPCILLGHSLGGRIAQMIAGCNPFVRGLVLLASVPTEGVRLGWEVLLRSCRGRYIKAMLSGDSFEILRDDARALLFNNMSFNGSQAAYEKLQPESGLVAREIMLGQFVSRRRLRKGPALVIGAEKDRIICRKITEINARRYGVEPKWFPLGHPIMWEKGWVEPFAEIVRFAREIRDR